MKCGQCGALLPEGASFCSSCGHPVQKMKAETEDGELKDWTLGQLEAILTEIAEGRRDGLTLTPEQETAGIRFLQFSPDAEGKLHAEACVNRGIIGYELQGCDGVSVLEAMEAILSFLAGADLNLPLKPDWNLI
ncbi:MAG: zinc ribbon domain-containing protein [Solobacterium sp.]|nr:zinc ribbon domain-containing protein [Solobacterium sp.]